MQKRLAYGSNLPYNTRATLNRANKSAGYDPEVLRLERSLQQVERQVIPFRHDKCPAGFDEYTRLPPNYPYEWKNSKNRFCVDPSYPGVDTTHRYDPTGRRDMDREEMIDTYLQAVQLLESDPIKKKNATERLQHRQNAQQAYAKTVSTGTKARKERAKEDFRRALKRLYIYDPEYPNNEPEKLPDDEVEKTILTVDQEMIAKVSYDHKGRQIPQMPPAILDTMQKLAPRYQTTFINAMTRYIKESLKDQQEIRNALRHAFK